MEEMILQTINDVGYIGIVLLILLETVFPPIPSEVILLFGGFMTTCSELNVVLTVLSATAGSYVGACILYGIGRLLDKQRLSALIGGKIGRFLHLRQAHLDKAFAWFERYENKAVFLCRCVPIVRSIISVPAGMSKMPFLLFSGLTVAGSAVWNTVVILLGRMVGSTWHNYLKYFSWYSLAALALLAIAAVAVAVKIIRRRRKANRKEP